MSYPTVCIEQNTDKDLLRGGPHRPASRSDIAWSGRPARGDGRDRAAGPGSGPGPGRGGGPDGPVDLVRDRDRPRRSRDRRWLRPARPRRSEGPFPAGPARHHSQPGSAGPPIVQLTRTGEPGPPGGYGTWRFSTGVAGQRDMLTALGPIPAGDCDHRHQAKGHDPGVMLRHLAQVRHATCTGPGCRRPADRCDFEHNIPYEAGGRTCLCNGNPACRHDHRAKQDPGWHAGSSRPATSAGPHQPAASTPPNPPATHLS
jgi:hypothetical protein